MNDIAKIFSAAQEQRNISLLVFNLLKKRCHLSVFAMLLVENEKTNLLLASDQPVPKDLKKKILQICVKEYSRQTQVAVAGEVKITDATFPKKVAEGKMGSEVAAYFAHPLTAMKKTLGLAGFFFTSPYTLTVDDRRFFSIIAGQISLFTKTDRIQQTIMNERDRLESMLLGLTDGVIAIDEHRHILVCNWVAGKILGVDHEQSLGKLLDEVIPQEELRRLFKKVDLGSMPFFSREMRIKNVPQGGNRFVKIHLSKIRDSLGQKAGTVVVLSDISREKEINRMKTEFISVASHELRTPLASIKEAVSLILDQVGGAINPKQEHFLGIARRNIDRLVALLNDFLDLSKIELGNLELHPGPLNIFDVATEVVGNFVPLAQREKKSLHLEMAPNLPKAFADRNRIAQVLSNLVSNALKFTPEGGNVVIRGSSCPLNTEYLQIAVADNGRGIDKKDIARLFQKFQQIDATNTRTVGGTGLGLVISKDIVELHRGKIWVESKLGQGSTFKFILPLANRKKSVSKGTVLVIDDDPDFCEILNSRLVAEGYKAFYVLDGKKGLEKLRTMIVHAVVVDLRMSGLDGFKILEKIKANPKTAYLPVIVLTALEDGDSAAKAMVMGASGYLVKPADNAQLLQLLEACLQPVAKNSA